MPSSVSSSSTSTSRSTTSTTASDIDHLAHILPYITLSKSQRQKVAINKKLSDNWVIAADGALTMALRRERIERQKQEEKERWLAAYRKECLKEQKQEETKGEEIEEPFVPCWEREFPDKSKRPESGWLFRILDQGKRTRTN